MLFDKYKNKTNRLADASMVWENSCPGEGTERTTERFGDLHSEESREPCSDLVGHLFYNQACDSLVPQDLIIKLTVQPV